MLALTLIGSGAFLPSNTIKTLSDSFIISASAAETVEEGQFGENVFYALNSEGLLTISGTGEIKDYGFNSSPFYGNENIKEVVINDGITYIGLSVFSNCKNLALVTIPDSVTAFGGLSFEGTLWLSEKRKENPFVVFNGILIDARMCSGNVIVPDNVTTISKSAFSRCSEMTSITIPESVTSIYKEAVS